MNLAQQLPFEGFALLAILLWAAMKWKGKLAPHWFQDAWDSFTDSLNTPGGTVALLFVSTLLLGFAVLHIMHHGDEGAAASSLSSTFNAFTGALLLALTQGGKKNGGNGGNGDKPNTPPSNG